jgi:type VI secretion system protein ImpH
MAAENGSADTPVRRGLGLDDLVFREGHRFEFFQAVRLLERMHPNRQPVGRHEQPGEEVVRFRSHVSMAFPPSEVREVQQEKPAADGTERPTTMWVTFLGLAGSMGVLPRHYTQLLTDPAVRTQTRALGDFLDIFNHRLISLFYRAWEKYRFPIAYERRAYDSGERARTPRGEDTFSQYLYCLIGMGTAGLQNRQGFSDDILLYYAGLLSQRPRSAAALEGILQDYFGVNVQVEQFTGQWFLMNPDALTGLGAPGERGAQNNVLGVDATLWERIWDPQARFRIRLGPLTFQQFQDFMPTSEAYRHLVELTRFFVGEEFSFEVQPVLRADEVPACALGVNRTTRLGWAMWLKTEPFRKPTSQPVFEARLAQPLIEGAA